MTNEIELIPSSEIVVVPPKDDPAQKDMRDIKSRLLVVPDKSETHIMVLAIHKEKGGNKTHRISCKRGVPIGGYVMDSVNDCYVILCSEYLALGNIPVSYRIELTEAGWHVSIPLPEVVIKRYLTASQKADLRRFKSLFSQNYFFQFVQLVNHN